MTQAKALDIVTKGIPFRVVIVEQGEKYGLNKCVTHEEADPLVEFYDARYKHTEDGQFVSRYYLSTLLETGSSEGINLQGGVPDWYIHADGMTPVMNWLKQYKIKKTA